MLYGSGGDGVKDGSVSGGEVCGGDW